MRNPTNVIRVALTIGVVAALTASPGWASPERAVTIDGPKATRIGHQVTFHGRVAPPVPAVTVGVYLGSSVVESTTTNDDGTYNIRPHLFTTGDYRARTPGAVSSSHYIRIVKPLLKRTSQGSPVRDLVVRLSRLRYAVESTSATEFTGAVEQSVYAFQKAQAVAVDGIVGPETRARLRDPVTLLPRYSTPAYHIEVDKERQLVLIVEDARVVKIINTSTAGIPGTHTPTGTFRVLRRVRGVDHSPLGRLYNPLYFVGGYAIHGSTSVPPFPASHGCVRVPLWEAVRLFRSVPHGEVVRVY